MFLCICFSLKAYEKNYVFLFNFLVCIIEYIGFELFISDERFSLLED